MADPRRLSRELAGGVGDWGLLIPIAVALVTLNGLDATIVFAGTGLTYVATALWFRVPVPVQPLKALGAAALALGSSPEVIAAGALLMSAALLALAWSGSAAWLAERFPRVLVRGIQAAVALLLVKAAVDLIADRQWAGLDPIPLGAAVAMAMVACAVLFAGRAGRFPGSLLVIGAGAGVGLAVSGAPDLALGASVSVPPLPGSEAFGTALTSLVLAQLPLTFGNSIVATADAEREYFGARARRVTPRALATSIGAANAGAGLLGGLPVCHGAGGVTAHYAMGARTWVATASAGAILLALAIALGDSLPGLLLLIPPGVLAGMLLFVALGHAALAARVEGRFERLVVAGVGVATLALGNLAWGFALGVAALLARRIADGTGVAGAARA